MTAPDDHILRCRHCGHEWVAAITLPCAAGVYLDQLRRAGECAACGSLDAILLLGSARDEAARRLAGGVEEPA